MRLSISRKMLLAPAAALGCFLAIAYYLQGELRFSRQQLQRIQETHLPVATLAGQNILLFEELQGTFRDAVEAREERWLDDAQRLQNTLMENLQALQRLDSDRLEKRVAAVRTLLQRYHQAARKLSLALIQETGISDDLYAVQIPLMQSSQEEARQLLVDFRDAEGQSFEQAVATINDRLSTAVLTSSSMGVVGLLGLIALTLSLSLSTQRSILDLLHSVRQLSTGKPDFSRRLVRKNRDELGELVSSFNAFTDKLESDYHALKAAKAAAEESLQRLSERNAKISTLLNNASDGFLSFAEDQHLDAEYSAACEAIIGPNLAGRKVAPLLFPETSEAEAFQESLKLVFAEGSPDSRNLMMELLPSPIHLGARTVEVDYRFLENSRMMLVLRDISHRKELERVIEEERDRLRMAVQALLDRMELRQILRDFQAFAEGEWTQLLGPNAADPKLSEACRRIHTFKGLFSQFFFKRTVSLLHQLENQLEAIQNEPNDPQDDALQLLQETNLPAFPKEDLAILRAAVKQDYESASATPEPLQETLAEELLQRIDKAGEFPEKDDLVAWIQQRAMCSLTQLLESTVRSTEALAQRLGKCLYPIKVTGDFVAVSPSLWKPWTQALVHVFRNALDHGIESPEERENAGKDPSGCISLNCSQSDHGLIITLQDDGRGLNTQAIRQKALDMKLIDPSNPAFDNNTVNALIFSQGLSTRRQTTEWSGRGQGLAAVHAETQRLKGSVQVTSSPGQGTTFSFYFPHPTKNGFGKQKLDFSASAVR